MDRVKLLLVAGSAPAILLGSLTVSLSQGPPPPPTIVTTSDSTGTVGTLTLNPTFDTTNPFFKALGTNARSCETCHTIGNAMTVSAADVGARFEETEGKDPIFLTVDGSNSPLDEVATLAERTSAYSMLTSRGVIRIGLPIPAGAQFTLSAVSDPYKFASAAELSLFRRPLPSANLRFLSSIMWDGRESPAGTTILDGLLQQAGDAVTGHEQGSFPSLATRNSIFNFEAPVYIAQVSDSVAGSLTVLGAQGGPGFLINQPWFPGINDPFGRNPQGDPFNPHVFTIYNAWANLPPDGTAQTAQRLSIARGQALFNTFRFTISGVAGLNDIAGRPSLVGSCTTCHNSPNVGDRSLPDLMHTGIADAALRTIDLPLYTLKNRSTGQTTQTTDPGAALISGNWNDIGKFKVPSLRGLAARSPYMHNGAFSALSEVVKFYNTRFNIGFTPQQQDDLVAFLEAL
jgi:cytochrome c peroxidase